MLSLFSSSPQPTPLFLALGRRLLFQIRRCSFSSTLRRPSPLRDPTPSPLIPSIRHCFSFPQRPHSSFIRRPTYLLLPPIAARSVSPVLFCSQNGGNARGFAMAATAPLCDLMTGHLLPFLDSNTARPYKETEKDLLISLTRVRREIQQMITKSSSEAEEMVGSSYTNHYCYPSLQNLYKGEEGYLCNIITSMICPFPADSDVHLTDACLYFPIIQGGFPEW